MKYWCMISEMWSIVLITVAASLVRVSSYPGYQAYIPNGNLVPDPCDRSIIWEGVGHKSPAGAGDRNLFGLDFASSMHVRTELHRNYAYTQFTLKRNCKLFIIIVQIQQGKYF